MKKNKNGFSLAEVLIAATIAAIIATMGFTIAKKGIERAYNLYIYSGYYAISTALSDAEDGLRLTIRDCVVANNLGDPDNCNFSKRITEVLSGRHIGDHLQVDETDANHLDFDTPNKINYNISPMRAVIPAGGAQGNNPLNYYLIRMRVPSVKQRNSNTKTVCMVYIENFTYSNGTTENILVPFYNNDNARCTKNRNNTIFVQDIQDRKDLLTFYLETELTGKVVDGVYYPRRFHSAKEAMCTKYYRGNPNVIPEPNGGQPLLRCTNNDLQRQANGELETGIIRVTDPRRI